MDARQKQRLSYSVVSLTLACVYSVFAGVISIVSRLERTLFGPSKSWLFASYSIGLFLGFFGHVLLYDVDPNIGEVVYHFDLKNPVKKVAIEENNKNKE